MANEKNMIDEAFRATPAEIRRWEFKKKMPGYNPSDVDNFRNWVADEIERLIRQNSELEQKAKGFHEQLRAFRERDKALNDALVSAQQLRSEIREQSEREAQLIMREARSEADRLVEAARTEVRRLEAELVALDRSRRAFIAQLRAQLDRQSAELTAAEATQVPISVDRDGAGAAEPRGEGRSGVKTPAWLDSLVKE